MSANETDLAVIAERSSEDATLETLYATRGTSPRLVRVTSGGETTRDGTPIASLGAVVGAPGPLLVEASVGVADAVTAALFRIVGARLDLVATDGAAVDGGGVLDLAAGALVSLTGRVVLEQEADPDGETHRMLVELRGGRARRLVGAGDATPLGGTFRTFSLLSARDGVVFVADVDGAQATGGVFTLGPVR